MKNVNEKIGFYLAIGLSILVVGLFFGNEIISFQGNFIEETIPLKSQRSDEIEYSTNEQNTKTVDLLRKNSFTDAEDIKILQTIEIDFDSDDSPEKSIAFTYKKGELFYGGVAIFKYINKKYELVYGQGCFFENSDCLGSAWGVGYGGNQENLIEIDKIEETNGQEVLYVEYIFALNKPEEGFRVITWHDNEYKVIKLERKEFLPFLNTPYSIRWLNIIIQSDGNTILYEETGFVDLSDNVTKFWNPKLSLQLNGASLELVSIENPEPIEIE